MIYELFSKTTKSKDYFRHYIRILMMENYQCPNCKKIVKDKEYLTKNSQCYPCDYDLWMRGILTTEELNNNLNK